MMPLHTSAFRVRNQEVFYLNNCDDSKVINIKMLYLIGPDGLVNQTVVNFQKMVWMATVHVLRFIP